MAGAAERARGTAGIGGSSQQFHEIAPAAESLLEACDIGRLLGRRAQAAHAGDEAGRLLVSGIAASGGEFIDPLGIGLQSLARMVGFAFAREALFDLRETRCFRVIAQAMSNRFSCIRILTPRSAGWPKKGLVRPPPGARSAQAPGREPPRRPPRASAGRH